MATADECRKALDALLGRINELDPAQRAANFPERTMSCRVPDLGLLFVTRIGPDGAQPVEEAAPDSPPAQVRFTANSDELVSIAGDPGSFSRAWLTGRLKVQASVFDLLRLRKFL